MTYQQPPQYGPGQHQQRMDRDRQNGQVQPWQPMAPVAPKSTAAALILGLLIPGVGCMYAGRAGLGIGILLGWIVSAVLVLFIIGWVLCPAMWITSGILGYTSAKRWNAEHGIIS